MAVERYKDVTIGGQNYRVGLVTALVGDWIVTQILAKRYTEEDTHRRVNDLLLNECSVYQDVNGVPVAKKIYDHGIWLVKGLDLEYDLLNLRELTEAALDFNVGPFFKKLREEVEAAKEAALLARQQGDSADSTQPSA